jgi:sugar lactone lactonase YvrE
VDKNQKIVIAVSGKHRIMRYKQSARFGRRTVGKNTSGYRSHLLCEPSDVIFDKKSKSLIICDYHHRRVVRWSPGNEAFAERLIENAECFGVAIDDTGSLYVSDTEQHEVRRYRPGDRYGTVVAGGNGQGRRLKQLNHPTYICIGKDQAVYVADSWNDRVVKWSQGAIKGVVVAGGNGKGSNRNQLDYPTGILVDQMDTVYVADHWNNRVMRWYKDAVQGNVIAGGLIPGDYTNQLNTPEGLAFDGDGNLYVSDSGNLRVQRFNIRKK